ncbi:Cof-type HAD-IIB family hydrolase [Celerinatantimonas yamalensis]|uniref:Cof-type HAD-IIB family hydrolase n=1 Tax=Celerinatantimonas yamalensis TaxID=559956 RepID=A0ABW9G5S5_9GAMM
MYRLIALDIDGTTLNSNHQISSRTIQAIHAAQAAGVVVVLASGRPVEGILMHLKTLELDQDGQFVISYNGALVQQLGSTLVLGNHQLTGRDAKRIGTMAQELNVHTHAFSLQRGLITPKLSHYTEHEAFMNEITCTTLNYDQLDDDEPMVKVMMIDEADLLQKAVNRLPVTWHQDFSVLRSAPYFLEFMHPSANKGAGVAALAEHLNIAREQVICVGDAGNDHHMLRWAGLGVAMGNADEQTKALADCVTATNDEDGVAQVIERFVLNQD